MHHQRGGLSFLNDLDNLYRVLIIELPREGPNVTKDAKRSNLSKKHKLNEMTISWKCNSDNPLQIIMGKDKVNNNVGGTSTASTY
ncbi:LOW QUALITY PROTEIN: hypothetical protein V2J09_020885 [Rumex salicifolius]